MILRLTTLTALFFVTTGISGANENNQVTVDADPAVATIRPLADGRRLVRLPALEFELDLRVHCDDTSTPRSVSISVNDTTMTLDAEQLPGHDDHPVSFSVPARQVSPVAVDGFCSRDNPTESSGRLLVRDAVTAHLSLRCASDDAEWITYASTGLDVSLQCDDTPEGQSSSDTER